MAKKAKKSKAKAKKVKKVKKAVAAKKKKAAAPKAAKKKKAARKAKPKAAAAAPAAAPAATPAMPSWMTPGSGGSARAERAKALRTSGTLAAPNGCAPIAVLCQVSQGVSQEGLVSFRRGDGAQRMLMRSCRSAGLCSCSVAALHRDGARPRSSSIGTLGLRRL